MSIVARIDAEGRCLAASEGAASTLGARPGAMCPAIFAARGRDGARVCRTGCTTELHATGAAIDHGVVQVRGLQGRLLCSTVGDEVVVTLEPTPTVERWAEPLTPREREVLEQVAQGRTSAEVARRLGISAATVRTHVEHARQKLGATTRAEAVSRALITRQITLASDPDR